MRERVVRRANILVLLAAVLLLAAVGIEAWIQFRAAQNARLWVRHTYEVLGTVKDLDLALGDASDEQRGFLLTNNAQDHEAYRTAVVRVAPLQARLQHLTSDNPSQQDRLRELAPLVRQKLADLAKVVEARRDLGLDAAVRILDMDRGRQLIGEIDPILAEFIQEEQRLLTRRLTAVDRAGRRASWLAAFGSVAGVGVLALAFALLTAASRRRMASEAAYRDLATQLRTVLDSISHGVGVIDAAGLLVQWNECLPVVLGLPETLMRKGTPYAALAEHLAGALTGGEPFLESRHEISRSVPNPRPVVYERASIDGRRFELRRDPIRDGGFVLTVTDVTDRMRLETKLREAQRMQAIGQLSGGIAHDFNNLLAVVLGNLELALGRLEAAHPVRPRLERAMWSAKHGASLTHQLLAFARKQQLAPKPRDLAAMLEEMADLLRRTLGETIELDVVIDDGLWPAMADAAQVESAVLNLALNARDAMPQGGRLTIEVANEVVDGEDALTEIARGEYVMIAVTDTGIGMSAEVVARAFEPFFTTKAAGKGTGLGLAMVFGFAKQSGGHARIESAPGNGTTVRLFLPRADRDVLVVSEENGVDGAVPRGSARVLVVEDEPDVRDVIEAILGDLGYDVLTACDGATALEAMAENAGSVELVLVDMVLPGGMTGREIARRVVESDPRVRTMFMSGYSEATVQDGAPGESIVLIAKPFERERLARLIAQALGTAPRV